MNANAEINAEQPPNALNIALSEINASIFEIGESIPEGVYLSMMNNSKKIFDEISKIKQPSLRNLTITEKCQYIMNKEDKIYKLRRITKENNNEGDYITLWETQTFISVRSIKVGQLLRIFETRHQYKFLMLTKINGMSIKYDIYKFSDGGCHIKRNNTLKFKDKDYYENLLEKNILFYDTPHLTTSHLFNLLIESHNVGDNFVLNMDLLEVNENLKITL